MKQTTAVKKNITESFAVLPGATFSNGGEIGEIKIYSGVVSSIVKRALSEIPGVSRLSGSSVVDNLAEWIGSRKIQDRSIMVRLSGDTVEIELSVNLYYGSQLPVVAAEIQDKVSTMVHSITGLNVMPVNVTICGMDEAPAETGDSSQTQN